jgi:gamma-glutamyltranspeptidase
VTHRAFGSRWGVAAPHPAATDAAAAVLEQGGTAIDGAIAAAGVLTVVYPHHCSVGGDLIALVRSPGERPKAVFGVGRSPASIDVDRLRRTYGERLPIHGPDSISVPGVVSGWQCLHQLGGLQPMEQLLSPAVVLASEGMAISPSLARALATLESTDPGIAALFGPPGSRLGTGDVVRQPALAETLIQVAAEPDAYYRGALAKQLAAALKSIGSPITLGDLSRHQPVVAEAPMIETGTLAPKLFTAGLPSQGPFLAVLAQWVDQLLAQGHDLTGRDASDLGRAFAWISRRRDELLADPSRVPGGQDIWSRLGTAATALSLTDPGRPLPRRLDHLDPGAFGEATESALSGDTAAVVTLDAAGSSVSMLQSVFHSFGAQVLDPVTGVLFHSRQSMFTLRRGSPGELGPRRMPPHTLCPIMVDTSDGAPLLLLATMGGRAQPQILTQVLLQLAKGMDARDALAAPRFLVDDSKPGGSQWVVTAENGVPDGALSSLEHAGFEIELVRARNEEMGHAQLLRHSEDGVVAAADPRSDGVARTGTL